MWQPECSMQNEPPWPGPLLPARKSRLAWTHFVLGAALPQAVGPRLCVCVWGGAFAKSHTMA